MDDGSSDDTQKYFSNLKTAFPYTYEWEPDKGFTVSHAKNRGIKKATGTWILIIDGDTFIDPNTLKAYDRVTSPNKDVVYFGRRFPIKLKDLDQALHLGFPTITNAPRDFRGFLQNIPPAPFYHFSGANFIIHADTAKELKYNRDDWNGYGYDDYMMALNYLLNGKTFHAVNDSIAYHCEDNPKPGDVVVRKRLNDFIKEHEKELTDIGQPVMYF